MKNLVMVGFLVIFVLSGYTHASLITYATRTEYNAAIGGLTTLDFEAQNTGGAAGYNDYGSNLTLGSVSFSQSNSRLRVIGNSLFQTGGLTSSFLCNDGGENSIVVNFSGGGIYALGIDVGQVQEYYAPVGNMTISLSSGDEIDLTGLLELGYTTNTLRFVGFASSSAMTSITFDDPSGTTVIDNFAYRATAIPEPGPMLTWSVLGLLGFISGSRIGRTT